MAGDNCKALCEVGKVSVTMEMIPSQRQLMTVFPLLFKKFMAILLCSRIQFSLRIGQARSAQDHSTIHLLSLSVPLIFFIYCYRDLIVGFI